MGKKDKIDPAEGAEVAPEYQAGVLAMARARMEASNADAEQGLAEAAAQTPRQHAAPMLSWKYKVNASFYIFRESKCSSVLAA